jgi:hypothetical protein
VSAQHWVCCCDDIDCVEWTACLPAQITVSFSYEREYTVTDDGNQFSRRYEKFTATNVVMQFDAFFGCMVSTGEGGTFVYELRFEQGTYPRLAFYVDDCPPCKDLQPCTEQVTTASGAVGPVEVRICCYDPCNDPQRDYPANTLDLELYATGSEYLNVYGECIPVFGGSIPPYPVPLALKARMYGQWECLDALTFECRSWDEEYWRANASISPAKLDNSSLYPQGVCSGAYAQAYNCIGFGTPQKTSYNLLCESAPGAPLEHFDVETCPADFCVDEHQCWQDQYGGTGTLLFHCRCDDCGGGGTGGGGGNSNGCVTRVFRDKCTTTFSASVP